MKSLIISFLVMCAVLCGISPVFAAEQDAPSVLVTRTFALTSGDTLWKDWMLQGGRRNMEWREYWEKSCILSRISCADDAWRHLPVGQHIVTPRAVADINTDLQKILAARKTTLDENESDAHKKEIESIKTAEIALHAEIEEWKSRVFAATSLLVLCVFMFALRLYQKSALQDSPKNEASSDLPDPSDPSVSQESIDSRATRQPHRDFYLPSNTPVASYPPKYVEPFIPKDE